jgi:hypothetical protein
MLKYVPHKGGVQDIAVRGGKRRSNNISNQTQRIEKICSQSGDENRARSPTEFKDC